MDPKSVHFYMKKKNGSEAQYDKPLSLQGYFRQNGLNLQTWGCNILFADTKIGEEFDMLMIYCCFIYS